MLNRFRGEDGEEIWLQLRDIHSTVISTERRKPLTTLKLFVRIPRWRKNMFEVFLPFASTFEGVY